VDDTETGTAPRRGGGRRARLEDTADIPRVKDATGEKVMESFSLFLEKCVRYDSRMCESSSQFYRTDCTA